MNGSANRGGAIGDHRYVDRRREGGLQGRQKRANALDDGNDIGSRLTLNVKDNTWSGIHPSTQLVIFGGVFDGCDILQTNRSAVFVGNDQVPVFFRGLELIVRVDGVGS